MKTESRVNDKVFLKNILFATDFSVASMQALPYATSIARQFGSKLYIAHVVPPEDYPTGLNSYDESAQAGCSQAEPKLKSVLNSAPCRGLSCEALIGSGDVWIGLSDFMRRHVTGLLVMGTIGRTGLKKLLLGSVAEEAMRESRCPVLTVGLESHPAEEGRFRHVLYATDFSPESLAAAPYALAIRIGQVLVEFHHRLSSTGVEKTKGAISALNDYGMEICHICPRMEIFTFVSVRNGSTDHESLHH